MPKILTKTVAALLVGCLTTDPSLAAAFRQQGAALNIMPIGSPLFERQALDLGRLPFLRSYKPGSAEWMNRAIAATVVAAPTVVVWIQQGWKRGIVFASLTVAGIIMGMPYQEHQPPEKLEEIDNMLGSIEYDVDTFGDRPGKQLQRGLEWRFQEALAENMEARWDKTLSGLIVRALKLEWEDDDISREFQTTLTDLFATASARWRSGRLPAWRAILGHGTNVFPETMIQALHVLASMPKVPQEFLRTEIREILGISWEGTNEAIVESQRIVRIGINEVLKKNPTLATKKIRDLLGTARVRGPETPSQTGTTKPRREKEPANPPAPLSLPLASPAPERHEWSPEATRIKSLLQGFPESWGVLENDSYYERQLGPHTWISCDFKGSFKINLSNRDGKGPFLNIDRFVPAQRISITTQNFYKNWTLSSTNSDVLTGLDCDSNNKVTPSFNQEIVQLIRNARGFDGWIGEAIDGGVSWEIPRTPLPQALTSSSDPFTPDDGTAKSPSRFRFGHRKRTTSPKRKQNRNSSGPASPTGPNLETAGKAKPSRGEKQHYHNRRSDPIYASEMGLSKFDIRRNSGFDSQQPSAGPPDDPLDVLLPAQSGLYTAVWYGEFVVTDAYRSAPIAITTMAGAGLVAAIYDPVNRVGAIAHFEHDRTYIDESVRRLLQTLDAAGADLSQLQIKLLLNPRRPSSPHRDHQQDVFTQIEEMLRRELIRRHARFTMETFFEDDDSVIALRTSDGSVYRLRTEESAAETDAHRALVNGAVSYSVRTARRRLEGVENTPLHQRASPPESTRPHEPAGPKDTGEPLAIAHGYWWGQLYLAVLKSTEAVKNWLEDPANEKHFLVFRAQYAEAWHAARRGDIKRLQEEIERTIAPREEAEVFLEPTRAAFYLLKEQYRPSDYLLVDEVNEIIAPLFESMRRAHDSFFIKGREKLSDVNTDPAEHHQLMRKIDRLEDGVRRRLAGNASPSHPLFYELFDQVKAAFILDHTIMNSLAAPGDPLLITPDDQEPAAPAKRPRGGLGQSIVAFVESLPPGSTATLDEIKRAIGSNETSVRDRVNGLVRERKIGTRGTYGTRVYFALKQDAASVSEPSAAPPAAGQPEDSIAEDKIERVVNLLDEEFGLFDHAKTAVRRWLRDEIGLDSAAEEVRWSNENIRASIADEDDYDFSTMSTSFVQAALVAAALNVKHAIDPFGAMGLIRSPIVTYLESIGGGTEENLITNAVSHFMRADKFTERQTRSILAEAKNLYARTTSWNLRATAESPIADSAEPPLVESFSQIVELLKTAPKVYVDEQMSHPERNVYRAVSGETALMDVLSSKLVKSDKPASESGPTWGDLEDAIFYGIDNSDNGIPGVLFEMLRVTLDKEYGGSLTPSPVQMKHISRAWLYKLEVGEDPNTERIRMVEVRFLGMSPTAPSFRVQFWGHGTDQIPPVVLQTAGTSQAMRYRTLGDVRTAYEQRKVLYDGDVNIKNEDYFDRNVRDRAQSIAVKLAYSGIRATIDASQSIDLEPARYIPWMPHQSKEPGLFGLLFDVISQYYHPNGLFMDDIKRLPRHVYIQGLDEITIRYLIPSSHDVSMIEFLGDYQPHFNNVVAHGLTFIAGVKAGDDRERDTPVIVMPMEDVKKLKEIDESIKAGRPLWGSEIDIVLRLLHELGGHALDSRHGDDELEATRNTLPLLSAALALGIEKGTPTVNPFKVLRPDQISTAVNLIKNAFEIMERSLMPFPSIWLRTPFWHAQWSWPLAENYEPITLVQIARKVADATMDWEPFRRSGYFREAAAAMIDIAHHGDRSTIERDLRTLNPFLLFWNQSAIDSNQQSLSAA